MTAILSPRIHNLGDFAHCLPLISGFVKSYGKVSFGICPRLRRFKGIKEFLMYQDLFDDVWFCDEPPENVIGQQYILIDDSGSDDDVGIEPLVVRKYYNFTKQHYPNLDFELDLDFQIKAPDLIQKSHIDKQIIGDRWAPNEAEDVDTRRDSRVIKSAGIIDDSTSYYLDYNHDMLYNVSLIKQSPYPFISMFTGIGIIADLMKKETVILWDDNVEQFVKGIWPDKSIQDVYKFHHWDNRNARLIYIKDFKNETN